MSRNQLQQIRYHIDDSIGPGGRDELILLINEYRDVFAKNLKELGCTNLIRVDLTENANSVPFMCYPYKTSAYDRHCISAIMKE